jgi:hypothetical protein
VDFDTVETACIFENQPTRQGDLPRSRAPPNEFIRDSDNRQMRLKSNPSANFAGYRQPA